MHYCPQTEGYQGCRQATTSSDTTWLGLLPSVFHALLSVQESASLFVVSTKCSDSLVDTQQRMKTVQPSVTANTVHNSSVQGIMQAAVSSTKEW